MTLRCEACGETAFEPDARFCIACGGRLAEVPDPDPDPDLGRSRTPEVREGPETVREEVPAPDIPAAPAAPRPVKASGDEVPLALVVAGVTALLLVLLALLVLT